MCPKLHGSRTAHCFKFANSKGKAVVERAEYEYEYK